MQERLFFEDVNDALREAVTMLGGAKKVGPRFWPEKTVEQAHSLLLACLNADRKERLAPEQVVLLLKWARAAGYHGAMNHICSETGYRAEPLNPEDEAAKLQREYIEAVQASKHIADRLERLTAARAAGDEIMAALSVIKVRYSPDLMAILHYLGEMMGRMEMSGRITDPRLRALINRLTTSDATWRAGLLEIDLVNGQIVVSPGDDLLDYVAKFRALERAMK